MAEILNDKEKVLLVSRKLLETNTEPTDDNIQSIWVSMFKADKNKLSKSDVYENVRDYVEKHNIEQCEKKIHHMRAQREKVVKKKARAVGKGVRMIKDNMNTLALYCLCQKPKNEYGNYVDIQRYIGNLAKKKKERK